jgi:O-antigen biosynthesis protein WbqV
MDLARDLIILSGFRPDIDIPIATASLGSGEKLREELVHDFEELSATRVPKIRAARRRDGADPEVEPVLERLEALARAADRPGIRRALDELLPEAEIPATGGEAASPGAALPRSPGS